MAQPSSESTVLIILGASSWPRSPQLQGAEAFRASYLEIKNYFLSVEGYDLPESSLFDRFDSDDDPATILEDLEKFVDDWKSVTSEQERTLNDLIVLYIGHGGFYGEAREYVWTIRRTKDGNEGVSSVRLTDFSRVVKRAAAEARRYIIVDACFSGKTSAAFQSPESQLAVEQLLAELPPRGTVVLSSTSARSPSIAPPGRPYTMFSEGLLHALKQGRPTGRATLSIEDVAQISFEYIKSTFPDPIRPEVSSPQQDHGDVAKVLIFPNAALRRYRLAQEIAELRASLDDVTRKNLTSVRRWQRRFVALMIVAVLVVGALLGSNLSLGTTSSSEARMLGAHSTVDASSGFQNTHIWVRSGQSFVLQPEGRIHLSAEQAYNFSRSVKPLIVMHSSERQWPENIKKRYPPPVFSETTVFYRNWTGPEGDAFQSDMLEDCKLRRDINWGALMVVVLPSNVSPMDDPFEVLSSNGVGLDELKYVPGRTTFTANRDGWLTFVINDAVLSPVSPTHDGREFYDALKSAAQELTDQARHRILFQTLTLVWYADNLGAFRITIQEQ